MVSKEALRRLLAYFVPLIFRVQLLDVSMGLSRHVYFPSGLIPRCVWCGPPDPSQTVVRVCFLSSVYVSNQLSFICCHH